MPAGRRRVDSGAVRPDNKAMPTHSRRFLLRERTAGESYLNFTKSVSYMLRISLSILIVQWFRRRK